MNDDPDFELEPRRGDGVVLTFSRLPSAIRSGLRRAAAAALLDLATFDPQHGDFMKSLATLPTRAVIVPLDSPWVPSLCETMRGNPAFAHVPIIGLAPVISDLSCAELYAHGGDDLIALDSIDGLVPRLRSLAKPSAAATRLRGRAVVADPDSARRAPLARVLRGNAFDVVSVSDEAELRSSLESPVAIVVLTLSLATPELFESLQQLASPPIAIVCAAPRELSAARGRLPKAARVALFDSFASPDNLLFLANEIISATATDRRAAPRLLHGTRAWLRPAGAEQDVVTFSFNVSGGGMFCRTLHPMELGSELWIETLPPRSTNRVRLLGQVVWRRPFGPIQAALSPAGVGVRISSGLGRDWDLYRDGCEQLARELGLAG